MELCKFDLRIYKNVQNNESEAFFQNITVEGCVTKLKQAGMVTLLRFLYKIFSTLTGAASMRTPVQLYLFSKSSVFEKSSPSRPPHSMKNPPFCLKMIAEFSVLISQNFKPCFEIHLKMPATGLLNGPESRRCLRCTAFPWVLQATTNSSSRAQPKLDFLGPVCLNTQLNST